MAAVSRGAREAGGHVVGVTLPDGAGRRRPNPWVSEERPAEDLFARLRMLTAADAWLAVAGGVGTLAEVALAWNLVQIGAVAPRPLVLVGPRWRALLAAFERELVIDGPDTRLVRWAPDPPAALALIA
jgi:predicted Rossmann-fold nucleotide-binding protein